MLAVRSMQGTIRKTFVHFARSQLPLFTIRIWTRCSLRGSFDVGGEEGEGWIFGDIAYVVQTITYAEHALS